MFTFTSVAPEPTEPPAVPPTSYTGPQVGLLVLVLTQPVLDLDKPKLKPY